MDAIALLLGLALGGAAGTAAAAAIWRSRNVQLAERLKTADQLAAEARAADERSEDALRHSEAGQREAIARAAAAEALLDEARAELARDSERHQRLGEAFRSLSAQTLQANNQAFFDLAKQTFSSLQQGAGHELDARKVAVEALVKPIHESLAKVGATLTELEKSRTAGQAAVAEQVASLISAQRQLSTETATLSRALRAPGIGGRWGEIQLQRVVELAGMLEHCDFQTQTSTTVDEIRLRPDLVVRLPGGKAIAVDSKAPLQGYLDALEATDEGTRKLHLLAHAKAVRGHLQALSQKSYWDRLQPSPEFVVLFLPGETFFSAALEQDPSLIEAGVEARVILATPTTLIALLRAVAYGWRQERLTKNAEVVAQLGKELHERIRAFTTHLGKVGKALDGAVASYNQAVGSLESRVLPGARKFTELGAAGGDELPLLEPLDKAARSPVE